MWNEHLCSHTFSWNQLLTVFELKPTSLNLLILVESTFDSFWSEIDIFELTSFCGINIWLFLKWNQLLWAYVLMWNEHFMFLKWNQHLWAYVLTWNQHFVVFDKKSTSLIISTFRCFWSEINIFAFARWCEIIILLFVEQEKKKHFCSHTLTWQQINTWRGRQEMQIFFAYIISQGKIQRQK